MSDDAKDKKDSGKGDGTGPETDSSGTATKVGFGELLGHIDSRIESILSKRTGKDSNGPAGSTGNASEGSPESIRDQLRAELAKLQGEEAAAKKEADRDVTIQELREQVSKLTEAKPEENVSKLTQFMWGKKTKKS